MSGYIGNIPVPQATQSRQSFTATASQTSFATVGYTAGFIDVYLNGVHLLDGTDYTATNGSDIVLTTGAALNDVVEFVAYETFSVLDQSFTGTTTTEALTATGVVNLTGNMVVGTTEPWTTAPSWRSIKMTDRHAIQATPAASSMAISSNAAVGASGYEYTVTGAAAGNYTMSGNLHIWNGAASGTIGGAVTFAEYMRIDSSGHAIIPAGVTLGTAAGVYSAANTLDDYEEGTFTATLTPATSGSLTLLSTLDQLVYTKIGRVVYVQGFIQVSGASSPVGADVELNLPFTSTTLTDGADRVGSSLPFFDTSAGTFTTVPLRLLSGSVAVATIRRDASTVATGDGLYISFNYIAV